MNYDIVPLASPVSFVRHLLQIGNINDTQLEHTLFTESNIVIEQYWEGSESLLYSPAVIAFASLVIAFSQYAFDCSEWLESLPDSCFHGISSTISNNILMRDAMGTGTGTDITSFDRVLTTVDMCIRSMKNIPSIRARTTMRHNSPNEDCDDVDVINANCNSNNVNTCTNSQPNGGVCRSCLPDAPSPTGVEELSQQCESQAHAQAQAQCQGYPYKPLNTLKPTLKRSFSDYTTGAGTDTDTVSEWTDTMNTPESDCAPMKKRNMVVM